jgi:hypothetical protein
MNDEAINIRITFNLYLMNKVYKVLNFLDVINKITLS